ncbi:MAG: hypothetical protein ACYTFI_15855, partial [Planctomycetota bacterium]
MGAEERAGGKKESPATKAVIVKRLLAGREAAFLIGLTLTLGVYFVVLPLFPADGALSRYRAMLVESGLSPPVSVFVFMWHLSRIALHHVIVLGRERRLLHDNPAGQGELTSDDLEKLWESTHEGNKRLGGSILLGRVIEALRCYRARHDIAEVRTVLHVADAEERERGMRFHRFSTCLLLAILLFGYVGRARGVSAAMGALTQSMDFIEEERGLSTYLAAVAHGLAMAQDALLVAWILLALGWPMQLLSRWRRARLLDRMRDYLRVGLAERLPPAICAQA